jgi:hypothetical protein
MSLGRMALSGNMRFDQIGVLGYHLRTSGMPHGQRCRLVEITECVSTMCLTNVGREVTADTANSGEKPHNVDTSIVEQHGHPGIDV